jgi:glycosyltransferase involved in cell wall biosynthesis
MTLYNEELLIDLAIKSAREFAQEFIIVDNGCTDRTIDIARECVRTWGLEAKFFTFKGDLRQARFFSFSKANCKWAFLHDGDHILQTKGKHAVRKVFSIVQYNEPIVYAFPLIRLYYDYFHVPNKMPQQPTHKLLYPNKPIKAWTIASGTRNLPDHSCPRENLSSLFAVWNIGIKRPVRMLNRKFWKQFRQRSKDVSRATDTFVARWKGVPEEELEAYAEDWIKKVMGKKGLHSPPDLEKYDGYPAVIQEEIDNGINRTALDTVDTIRCNRLNAGLSAI